MKTKTTQPVDMESDNQKQRGEDPAERAGRAPRLDELFGVLQPGAVAPGAGLPDPSGGLPRGRQRRVTGEGKSIQLRSLKLT